MKQKAKTGLIYGDTGSTKTSQLYHLAKWLLKLYPKMTIRLVTADSGGYAPFEDSGLIEEGRVQVCDISADTKAYTTVQLLSQGYWPRGVKDNGLLDIQPDDKYRAGLGNVSAYMVEGITSLCDLWVTHLMHIGDGNAGFVHSFKFEEEGFEVGGLAPGHLGLIQNELSRVVKFGFHSLPVKYGFWTALVNKGEDRRGETVYGPSHGQSGTALVSKIPSWFGDCICITDWDVEKQDGSTVTKKVAWIVNHKDKMTDITYPSKVRCMPELVPELFKAYPGGYVELGFKTGIEKLYQTLRKITKESKEKEGMEEGKGKG